MNELKRWCVYVHTNKINGKTYVGITGKKPEERWLKGTGYRNQLFYKAIQKYGWDGFKHEVVADNLSEEEAKQMEIMLIDKLGSMCHKHGYNATKGGDSGSGVYRAIYQFDLSGNLIESYECIADASRKYNLPTPNIVACCTGKYAQAGGYIWKYQDDIQDLDAFKEGLDCSVYDSFEPIYQFDMKQNFIAEYESASEVSKRNPEWLSCSILSCCRGKYKHSAGYVWKFKKDVPDIEAFKNVKIDFTTKKQYERPVYQFDFDGNLLKEYSSPNEAAKCMGCDSHTITYACSGRTKSGVGYLWRYKENFDGIPPKYEPPNIKTKAVEQYDLNGVFIKRFKSAPQAERELGISAHDIRATCRGDQKTSGNYIWKFALNENEEILE